MVTNAFYKAKNINYLSSTSIRRSRNNTNVNNIKTIVR